MARHLAYVKRDVGPSLESESRSASIKNVYASGRVDIDYLES